MDARPTKRAQAIEEKLKNKKVLSLFDTDGDLSRHNIIKGSRRTREPPKRKTQMPMYKNAKEKLFSKKKNDSVKNEWISTRLNRMAEIQKEHDTNVKELYHLDLFQNLLEYNQTSLTSDVRYHQVNYSSIIICVDSLCMIVCSGT